MNVLVVVGHADDEVLGCGGTIAKHVEAGDTVRALYMTTGLASRGLPDLELAVLRRAVASEEAASILGFEWLDCGQFPDNSMDSIPYLKVVQFIESFKEDFPPDLVYTHWPYDINVDHRITCLATITAFRPLPDETCAEIRFFEVPSATGWGLKDFEANCHVVLDVSHLHAKVEALKAYDEEMREWPHAREKQHVVDYLGFHGSEVGRHYVERFHIFRRIEE